MASDEPGSVEGEGIWRPPPAWMGSIAGVAWRILVITALVALAIAAMVQLQVVVLPLILAVFLAAAMSPLHERLVGRGWSRGVAALACAILAVAVAMGVFFLVVRALLGPVDDISAAVSKGVDRLDQWLVDVSDHQGTASTTAEARASVGSAVELLTHGAFRAVNVAVSVVSTFMLSILVLFFYLKDGPSMWAWVVSFTGSAREVTSRAGMAVWHKVAAYVWGTAAVAAVDALGIGLGALILGTPFVGAIALMTFFLAFIPYYGAIIGGAIAVLVALGSGGFGDAIAMVGIVLFVQQVEANLLQPFLVGKAVRLHPLAVALVVIAGGVVAGVLGMFLAVPLLASAVAAIGELRASEPGGSDGALAVDGLTAGRSSEV